MSLKAIAQELGLSITTVSRALNGYSDVALETRQKIEAVAQRVGYRPNSFARRLKMGKIDAVGLIYPYKASLNNDIFFEMIGAISHELAHRDVDLLLIADDESANRHGFMRMLESCRVDAMIVAHTRDDDPRLRVLQERGFPFLALGRSQLPAPYAWFDFDNFQGTYLAVEHLIAQGHSRIALLSENNQQAFIHQRRQGYREALLAHGLVADPQYLCLTEPTRRSGYQQTQKLLAMAEPPTAIISDCNTHGEGAAIALHEAHQLTGPQAVTLVVYDGLPADTVVDVDVTAICQSSRVEVGRQIAQMTLDLIAGKPLEQLQVLWQPTLRPRTTSHSTAD